MKNLILFISIILLSSCSSAYYNALEKFGYEKRDILKSRVIAAKEEQLEAKEQFQSSLEKLNSLINFKGGSLEDKYLETKADYEDSEAKANDVSKKIDSIESVAQDLFEEWEDEIQQYSNARLKSNSQQKLRQTKTRYNPLINSMRKAESKMEPVLSALKDQMLYLKHNLNAQAVSSIKNEFGLIKADINSLIREMNASIAEADKFVSSLN